MSQSAILKKKKNQWFSAKIVEKYFKYFQKILAQIKILTPPKQTDFMWV